MGKQRRAGQAEQGSKAGGKNGQDFGDVLPLFPEIPEGLRYPTGALGNTLGLAAEALSRKVQVPLALAAQSVLAAASLVVQGHADIELPFGQTRPLSLSMMTIAESGDRKSSSDKEALWPVRKYERALQ